MRSQIFMVPAFQEPYGPGTTTYESGLWLGVVCNCDTDEELMEKLEGFSFFGHYVEVTLLKDDEPFPSIEERRNDFLREDL